MDFIKYTKTFLNSIEYSSFLKEAELNLLLFNINKVNKYTSVLPFNKFIEPSIENIAVKKSLCVDMKLLDLYEENNVINNFPMINSMYPIQTLADGNCLV